MPRLHEETVGAGDQSWLGSTHGMYDCQTVAPSGSEFTITNYASGAVPSGTPLAIVDGLAVPFDAAGHDGSEVLAGFLYTDQSVRYVPAEGGWPMLWHGRIKVDRLPVEFDPAGVESTGQFSFTELEGS